MEMIETDLELIAWYEQHKDSEDLKVLGSLISKLKELDWHVSSIWDGEELYTNLSTHFCKMIASNLDEYSIRFRKGSGREHGVLMINGNTNGEQIADWNMLHDDADGFGKAMDEVTEKIWKQYDLF